ncbi:MAG: type IV pilus assembly protein PilM [candidate division NC10 bacterium]|nr:type IV pilus assembly protein PilM [candidate division NC10 bacterium]
MNFKRKAVLGLDIGINSIKVVEISASHGGFRLLSAGFREIDIRRREGLDERSAIIATIRDLIAENRIRTKQAVSALYGPSTLVRRIMLPKMPDKELANAVRWEVAKLAPFPVERALVDFVVLHEFTDHDGAVKYALLVAAVEQSFAEAQASIIKEAGLEPMAFTVIPLALWNLNRARPEAVNGQVRAYLDLGAAHANFAFFKGSELQFSREITAAGDTLTDALMGTVVVEGEKVEIDSQQAERYKRGVGLEEELEAPLEGHYPPQMAVMLRQGLERLLTEIKLSLGYYQEQFYGATIQTVIVSGGTSRLRNLVPFLADGLGLPVEAINPFATLELSPALNRDGLTEVGPRFAVAIGLALEPAPAINLLPPRLKVEKRLHWVRFGLRLALAALVLFFLMFYAFQRAQVSYYQRALAIRKVEAAKLVPAMIELEGLRGLTAQLGPKLEAYEQLVRREPIWHGVLKELSHITPKNISLTEIAWERGSRMRLKGVVFSDPGMGAEEALAKYIALLTGSPFFREVDLITSSENQGYGVRALEFEITLGMG